MTRSIVMLNDLIKREAGSIADWPRSGRPLSVRTPRAHQQDQVPPMEKSKAISKKDGSSSESFDENRAKASSWTDLGFKAYKTRKAQGLTQQQRLKRHQRSKALLERFADKDLDQIVYSDEKFFSVQEKYNSQNVRVYAVSIEDISEDTKTVDRFQSEDKAMIWCGMSKKGKFSLHFVEPKTKVNANYYNYKRHILTEIVKPNVQQMYNGDYCCFQQDSAPAHKAVICQNYPTSSRHR